MNVDELCASSATALARLLQRRELRAETLVRACLERIDAREGELQAWTVLGRESALAQARELDRGPVRGLLHGLPLGIKDIFDTADLPTAYGSPIYAGHQPAADAASVALCREAGAVLLGKTVTTEFATYQAGPTRNPHDARHTPGGSSSGSAAAVGAGMVPLAFGTQTAGSIIRPAAFCGVVGYKPSFGLVARAGIKNQSDSLDTLGGFGREVGDVALLGAALTGDAAMLDLRPAQPPRIGLCRTPMWEHALPETQAAMERAAAALARAGAQVSEVVLPASCTPLAAAQIDIMTFEAARALSHERLRHRALLGAALQKMLDTGIQLPFERYRAQQRLAARARGDIDEGFAGCDILLAPSAPGEAPPFAAGTGDPVFCRMWTLLGLPCVHLPFATGPQGLPVGLQAIGRFGADAALLRAAAWAHPHLRPG